jgi:hypothetical protein
VPDPEKSPYEEDTRGEEEGGRSEQLEMEVPAEGEVVISGVASFAGVMLEVLSRSRCGMGVVERRK